RSDDAVRPVLHAHSTAGHRRKPQSQEADSAVARHVPGDDTALLEPAGWRDRDRGRVDVLPGVESRADRRTLPDDERAGLLMTTNSTSTALSIWDPQIVRRAIWDSFRKLHPRTMARNPVMLVVEVGSVLTTWRFIQDTITGRPWLGFEFQI